MDMVFLPGMAALCPQHISSPEARAVRLPPHRLRGGLCCSREGGAEAGVRPASAHQNFLWTSAKKTPQRRQASGELQVHPSLKRGSGPFSTVLLLG